jgi:arylsulfatase A-like enzyme
MVTNQALALPYFTCFLVTVVLSVALPAYAETPLEKPNILLIFADDIGYEALNCYGGLDFKTPHLDAMASEGLRFSRAYTSPLCTPSRVSMHTSLYTPRHGHWRVLEVHLGTRKTVDFERMTTYAQLMRANGYATSVTGKWQLATLEFWPDHIRSAGFDSWCVWQIWRDGAKTLRHWNATLNHDGKIRDDIAERFGPDVLTEYVIDQMRTAHAANQPFLIVHNELLPHFPMIDTPDDRELGREKSLGNMIAYMDKLVGQVLDEIESLGIRDNTYVIFMGDNGTQEEYFANPKVGQPNEKPHTRHTVNGFVDGGKFTHVDAGGHVPLIVWGPPSVPQDESCDDLVDVVDLFPTFCELSNTPVPESLRIDGRNLVPQIHGKPGTSRAFTHEGTLGNCEAVFDGSWRLVRRGEGEALPAVPIDILTDRTWLDTDPFEVFIDARNLPAEILADPDDLEAIAAKIRLKEILGKIGSE